MTAANACEGPAEGWTHRAYFKQFRLNIEQYGEILVADAFGGEKKGDTQPCYDVETTDSGVRAGLINAGVPLAEIYRCLSSVRDGRVRIEVKCKLVRTPSGKAAVIHCRNKLRGVRRHLAATHFAVILFDGDGAGIAEEAWLFTTSVAERLRRKDTKSGYIPVSAVRRASASGTAGLANICSLINRVSSRPLGYS